MKAIGVVRRIDELGRVVIPKEVRDTHGWFAGKPMEMFVDGDCLVIKGYGDDNRKQELINVLTESYNNVTDERIKDQIRTQIDELKQRL